MSTKKPLVCVGTIQQRILLVRGEKIIIDADLAQFYGVSTKRLNEQVKRNKKRFPKDFMFRLTSDEKSEVVANCDHLSKLKYSKTRPYAFTEHGAIMAASILKSSQAVDISIFIVRAFLALRRIISESKELAQKMTLLERKVADHDQQILSLVQAIRELVSPKPVSKKRQIGFHVKD